MLNKFYNFCNHQKFEFTSLRNECISNIPKLSVASTNKQKKNDVTINLSATRQNAIRL